MLKLDNVTISYKNVPTVQNFNLDMKEGQIVSLVGESGSGKSTLIYSPGCFRTVPPDFRQLTTLILCHNFLEMTQPS